MRKGRRIFILLITLASLMAASLGGSHPPARAQDEAPPAPTQSYAPQDIPDELVPSGATQYTMKAPKVFWYTGVPICPPPLASGETENPWQEYHETIQRVATYGSPPRTLYDELVTCSGDQVLSNIVSDGDFLYWLGPIGLMKLSTDANPGDEPQLMNALVQYPGEVADGGDRIYAIHNNTGGSNTQISYVRKDNNQKVYVNTPGNYAGNLQVGGSYIYYLVGQNLIRQEPGVDTGITIAPGVTGYYPEGVRLIGCTTFCVFSDNVYVGQGQNIRIYNNFTGTLGNPIYTSVDPTALMITLVTDQSKLFFMEQREIECSPQPCFPSYTTVLQRTLRSGGSADSLYTYGPTLFNGPNFLKTDGSFLYWHEEDKVLRLPNDAAVLPQVNMFITGMEVTQGIQNLSNGVLLVQGKRTFVRVYVKSAGPAVSGVSARLVNTALGDYPLQPVNPAGTKITVRATPNRDDINQSFLFELPWSWVEGDALHLRAELNPYKVPLEPNYADNQYTADLTLNASPALSVEFFRLNYTLNNINYSPRIVEDVLKTYSWIQRAYPIGGAIGENFKPRLWDVAGGTNLGSLVNQSNPICAQLYGGAKDDPALCASYVANGWLFSYRIQTMFGILNIGLKADAFYYGMISDASNNFPRGQAVYTKTSVGPAGTPGQFFGLGQGWDTDGSYADWYAAHEIGHSLGRAHPNAGSDNPATDPAVENCGHSRSDPGYPYGNTSTSRAPIGPADGSMEGFDAGDPYFNIAKAVYPSGTWNDVMSYCSNQWISDYTYTGMYNYMIAHPSQALSPVAPYAGDYLAAAGEINPVSNIAGFAYISRLSDVSVMPDLIPGDYSLRLLDGSNNVLADYAFTPELNTDTGNLGFGQVVNFVAGTRTVQIVRLSDQAVLTSQPVSANPPAVSEVALQGAPDPVSGVVTLGWTASDPDGGALAVDVAYSRDNGVTFQPVAAGLSGSSTQIDTASLGGSGTAVLRVTASDGVNNAYADSAPFVMAPKPPQAIILSPENGLHIHYGQLVNFSGTALDVQDGSVAEAGLAWRDESNTLLGNGSLLSLDTLPVGENTITLQATNSLGESATTSVTVFVDDDLDLPGPTLTAGPTPLGWQVPSGSTELQTVLVSVGNAGSGDLEWTAASDAAWLSLSAAAGTVTADGDPNDLTVTADPTGLAANTTYTATLTITKPSTTTDPEQVVSIPVSLSVGDVHSVPPTDTSTAVFLPLVIR